MRIIYFVIFAVLCPQVPLNATEISSSELERWFESDDDAPPANAVSQVNEGELVFLAKPPDKVVHYHQNRLVIDDKSLSQGWVLLVQCHENLDQVPSAQITYSRERVRQLVVTSRRNIGESWVENNSLQLRDIGANARVCVEAHVRALVVNEDGSYSLHNGPFMRRFLDGYYPLHLSMEIDYSASGLQLVDVHPVEQRGFSINDDGRHVSFDTWFEGRLQTEFLFWRD